MSSIIFLQMDLIFVKIRRQIILKWVQFIFIEIVDRLLKRWEVDT